MKTPDYSKFIKKSLEIVKKHKWLWIFGLILSGGGSGSANLRLNNIFDLIKESDKDPTLQEDLGNLSVNVLGTFTSNLHTWLVSIPASKWFLIALLVFLLIIMGIAISLVISNWAKASLISGVNIAITSDQIPTLTNTSPVGVNKLKSMIIFSLLMTLTSILVFITIPLVWGVVYLIAKTFSILKILWIILGGITSVILFFLVIVMLAIMQIYAERLIVLHDYSPSNAWKKSLKMSKKSLLASLLMGIINFIVSSAVGCVSIFILGISLGIPGVVTYQLYEKSNNISWILVVLIVLAVLIFICLSLVVRAGLTVFNYSNWNQLYLEYLKFEKENGKKQ